MAVAALPEVEPQLEGLPLGWVLATLDQLASRITSGSRDWSRYYGRGNGAFVRCQNIRPGALDLSSLLSVDPPASDPACERSRIAEGDLLISIVGNAGDTCIVKNQLRDHFVCQSVALVRPVVRETAEYLHLFLNSEYGQQQFAECAYGAGRAHLSFDQLRRTAIRVAPLAEQRRIVEKVESLLVRVNAARARLDSLPAILKHFRESVLAVGCSGQLTSDWRIQNRSGAQSDAATKDDIPDSWRWEAVGGVADVQGGIQKQPSRRPVKNHFPYLRVANVLRGKLDLSEIHRMELFPGDLERCRLEPGDLLVVEGNGSLAEIGRCAIWQGAIENCVHQNHIIRVRFHPEIRPEFAALYWNSPLGADRVSTMAVTTAGLYSLSTKKISNLPVPIPPLDEQDENRPPYPCLIQAGQCHRTTRPAGER